MKSITTVVTHRFIATVIKGARAIIRVGEHVQLLGERLEVWADALAVRRRCVEDVLALITEEALEAELSPNFGDGRTGQAAAVVGCRSVGLAMTSIPSLNVTARTSFGNWL